MNKLKIALLAFSMLIGVAAFTPSYVSADAKSEITKGFNNVGGDTDTRRVETSLKTVVNVMLYIIGAISVIMIVYGGIRYTISAGDSTKVTAAKNTIMYAVVGLLVALFAYAIVNFVLTNI
jgi:hypothetical protein